MTAREIWASRDGRFTQVGRKRQIKVPAGKSAAVIALDPNRLDSV